VSPISTLTIKRMKNKKLILSLIKSDVINNKLLSGLGAIGFEAIDYYALELDDRIFELMNLDITDENARDKIFEKYMKIVDKAAELDISKLRQNGTLDAIAENVYEELLKCKLVLRTAEQA